MKFLDYRSGALASVATVLAGVSLAPQAAMASTLSFQACTSNSLTDVAIAEAQLFADLLDEGSGQVRFNFRNIGPAASSISEVYFDDGTLLGIATLVDFDDGTGGDAGVDFTQDGSPPNLPGANDCPDAPFVTTAGFLADADAPAPTTGVNPGEQLGVIFDLQSGQTIADVQDQLATGALRIGFHVIAFADGQSESFVNNTPLPPGTAMPAPGMLAIFGLGLFGLGYLRRRRGA